MIKIADKITSIGKPKEKAKEKTKEKPEEIYITPEKKTRNYWWLEIILKNVVLLYKNGISKNYKFPWYKLC